MTTTPISKGLTLTVELGPQGVAQFQAFISEQHRFQIESECEFPGYEFVVGHWPPVDFWEVQVTVGSIVVVIKDVKVSLEEK